MLDKKQRMSKNGSHDYVRNEGSVLSASSITQKNTDPVVSNWICRYLHKNVDSHLAKQYLVIVLPWAGSNLETALDI